MAEDGGAAFRIEVAADESAIGVLRDAWNQLAARAASNTNLFQSYDWNALWWRHFGVSKGDEPRILTLWQGEQIVCIWPLMLSRRHGVRILRWSTGNLLQYGDVLVEPGPDRQAALLTAWQAILSWRDVDALHFTFVRDDGSVYEFLSRRMSKLADETARAPYLDSSNAEERQILVSGSPARRRKDLRRRRRRLLEQDPDTTTRAVATEDHREVIERLLSLKRDWTKSHGTTLRAMGHPAARAFLEDYAQAAHAKDNIRLSVLEHKGEPIAIEYAMLYRGRFYSYAGAFDPRWSKLSPGRLLIEDTLRWCAGNDVAVVDFLPPVSRYKEEWASRSTEVTTFALARNWRGRLYIRVYRAVVLPIARRIQWRLPRRWAWYLESKLLPGHAKTWR